MNWLIPIALIVAGVIAASSMIIANLPKAKEYIDKMAPIQGVLGVGLLVVGLIKAIQIMDNMTLLNNGPVFLMIGVYGGIACAVLLGFLLGMPLIAKWIPGDSPAEQKAMEMQRKIVPYQTLVGFAGIVTAIILIYYNTK